MSLPIHVEAYSGYKGNQRPRQFTRDEQIYEIAAVVAQWYEPSATYFKVQSTRIGRLICFDTMQRQMNGRCRVALMAMNFWRDQALNWSPSILRLQRTSNSELNRANTVTLPMPKFRSTGF